MIRRTLLMLVLAACNEAHEARDQRRADERREVDEVGADDAASGQSGPASAVGRVPDRDSASDGSSADVDSDAGLGMNLDSAVKPAESCPAHAVDVRGESEFGPLQVTGVSVEYWDGFTMGTTLLVRATTEGRTLEIHTRVYTIKHGGVAAPAGEYRTSQDPAQSGDMSLFARFCDEPGSECAGSMITELRHAVLRVDTHEISQPVKLNAPVRFEGRLRISDPGWSLDLPFALRWTCGRTVDL